jgi:hypothetical protein
VANLSLMDHYVQLSMIGAADEPLVEGYRVVMESFWPAVVSMPRHA